VFTKRHLLIQSIYYSYTTTTTTTTTAVVVVAVVVTAAAASAATVSFCLTDQPSLLTPTKASDISRTTVKQNNGFTTLLKIT